MERFYWSACLHSIDIGRSEKDRHEAVVRLLLMEDSMDPDSRSSEYGQTALSWAVRV